MTTKWQAFFSAPPIESQRGRIVVSLLNRLVLLSGAVAVAVSIAALISQNYRLAISLLVFLLLMLGSKLLLNQQKFSHTVGLYLASLSALHAVFLLFAPLWFWFGLLPFIAVCALLLTDLRSAAVILIINGIATLALTYPTWQTNPQPRDWLGWGLVSLLVLLLALDYFITGYRQANNRLLERNALLLNDSEALREELQQKQTQVEAEAEARRALGMRIQDELHKDQSHRYNPQTGVYNEQAVKEIIAQEILRTRRYKRPLSLLCIRVDSLIDICEQSGLTPGRLLAMLSDAFNQSLRREDILGHYGDVGFYVVLPETGRYASYVVAERLRHLVEVMSLFDREDSPLLSISIGLVAFQDQGNVAPEAFMQQSQDAMRAAVEHGGNWTISWHDLSHSPL